MWKNLRKLVLARDPICAICQRNASTVADHIIPHKGSWTLFSDLNDNLQGICIPCHDRKTAREDGGFGNFIAKSRFETNGPQPIGENGGRVFQSSSISAKKLDAALDFNVEDLLKGIPK